MPPEAGLAALQRRFYELVVAPEGVAAGLAALALTEADLDRMIVGDARLPATARLDIYAHMYFFRLRDLLASDYPKVHAIVGDEAFHDLAVDYLGACRPHSATVRDAGDRLPDFLAAHPLADERAWLADLARLERARLEVFDGFPDVAPVSFDALRTVAPEDFAALTLGLVPARVILETRHAVGPLWKALEEGGASDLVPEPTSRAYLVWRQDTHVYHRSLDDEEREALRFCERGDAFGLLCDHLARSRSEEDATRAAFELLARWVTDGLFAASPNALSATT